MHPAVSDVASQTPDHNSAEAFVTREDLREFFMESHKFTKMQAGHHARNTLVRLVNGLGDALVAHCSACGKSAQDCHCDRVQNPDGQWVHAGRNAARWRISKESLVQILPILDEDRVRLTGYTRDYMIEYITCRLT